MTQGRVGEGHVICGRRQCGAVRHPGGRYACWMRSCQWTRDGRLHGILGSREPAIGQTTRLCNRVVGPLPTLEPPRAVAHSHGHNHGCLGVSHAWRFSMTTLSGATTYTHRHTFKCIVRAGPVEVTRRQVDYDPSKSATEPTLLHIRVRMRRPSLLVLACDSKADVLHKDDHLDHRTQTGATRSHLPLRLLPSPSQWDKTSSSEVYSPPVNEELMLPHFPAIAA
ncbi:hypothetical protein FA95DRAFT_136451 [Auriscalpium vulgare]|uniref:Uncharacterized protein n=1 Tax=Auriscalpium vulgare TaxID=40419 RepID=A0ACB8RMC7_9AGAM|nr:hypothetical protein FA95DRAFT_136451 [Auriscalpium vulgare]